MNSYMQTIALIEISLSSAALIILLLQKLAPKAWPFAAKALLVIILANVFFWPLGLSLELPLAAYIRGVTGDFSILTMLLLWTALLPSSKPAPLGFKVTIAVLAIVFYPFALGLGMTDPYAWGYASVTFLIAVIVAAVICGLANWSKGIWMIAIAIIAWSAHWHESANLWDYLLDPFLAIWAISATLAALYRKRQDKARSGYLFRPG
jgi:hypothetical protein